LGKGKEWCGSKAWKVHDEAMKRSKKVIIVEKKTEDGSEVTEDVIVTPPAVWLSELEIFSNPAQEKVNVLFGASPEPTIVKVLDMEGKVIFSEEIQDFDGRYAREIDLGKGQSGGVILQIIQGGEIFSEKILNN